MDKLISIAIDGPAGAGKSSTAKRLASALRFVYVDSGAMYRAVALETLGRGIDLSDSTAVTNVAAGIVVVFLPAADETAAQRLVVDGSDVTDAIRSPQVSQAASTVSTISGVREILVAKQRQLGAAGGVVMEGRDIGTVVMPDAQVKVFLTASLDERARRRYLEMQRNGMQDLDLANVKADIAQRDHRDTTRAVSPLACAKDAVVIESDRLSLDQVVGTILELVRSAARTHHSV